jgi:hypothetical protein
MWEFVRRKRLRIVLALFGVGRDAVAEVFDLTARLGEEGGVASVLMIKGLGRLDVPLLWSKF